MDEQNELIERDDAPEEISAEYTEERPAELPAETPEETPEQPAGRPVNMRTHYLIRILVGGYLAYLGGQLIKNYVNGVGNKTVAGIAGVAFILIGVALVGWSVVLMTRGDS